MAEIADGVICLHSKKIIHGDLVRKARRKKTLKEGVNEGRQQKKGIEGRNGKEGRITGIWEGRQDEGRR
jgi:hypothetical protein